MAKRIVTQELNEKLLEAKRNSEGFLKVFDRLFDKIRDSAKEMSKLADNIDLDSAKGIENLNKLFGESNDIVGKTLKLQSDLKTAKEKDKKISKELLKLAQEGEKVRQAEIKTIREEEKNRQELLKTQIIQKRAIIQEQKEQERLEKERIKQVNATKKETDAYKQLARQRTLAQNAFKRLAVEFGENSRQAQEALEVFNELDESFTAINKTVKDGRPFVGRYADAIAEAGIDGTNTTKILGDLQKEQLELNKTIKAQTRLFGKNSDQVNESTQQLEQLEKAIKEVGDASDQTSKEVSKLGKAFNALASATIIIKAIELIGDLFSSSDSGASGLEKTLGRLTITLSVVIDRLVKGFDFFKNSFLSAINSVQLSYFEFLNSLNTAPINIGGIEIFEGIVIDVDDKLKDLRKTQQELGKDTTTLSDIFSGFTDEINSKIEANDRAIDQNLINIKQNAILRKSAAELTMELENLAKVYDNDAESLSDRDVALTNAIAKQEELNQTNLRLANSEVRIAELRRQASTDSAQAIADLIDAQTQRIEVETQGLTELNNLRREQALLNLDILDLNLDFYLDDADNRKTVNERIIADETQTQARRRALLEENNRLIEESFNKQAEVVNKGQELLGKEQLDFNELLTLDTEQILERLQGVNERTSLRVLEIIRERRTALQDLADTQRDLSESDREILKTTEDIILQEETLARLREQGADSEKIIGDLEKSRFEQKKKNLQDEIDLLDQNSQTRLEKEQELNDLLIEEESRRASEEKAIRDKELEEEKKRRQEQSDFIRDTSVRTASAVLEGFVAQSQAEQDRIQESIDQAKDRNNQLLALSQSSNSQVSQFAADSLAEQRELEREQTQALEEEKKKQIRLETVLAGLQAFGANAGQPNATGKTLADIGILIAGLTASAGSFYSGTDRLTQRGGLDSKGGFNITAHPNEMVIQESLNKKMGFPSRYDVADVFTKFKDGKLVDINSLGGTQVIAGSGFDEYLVDKLVNSFDKVSRNKVLPSLHDDVKKTITYRERVGNRINNYTKKVN